MEYNKQQEIYNFLKEYTEDTGQNALQIFL